MTENDPLDASSLREPSAVSPDAIDEVLRFWFEEAGPRHWWKASKRFDALLVTRFLDLLQAASAGELYAWRGTPRGRLAEIIVLDQFSRNVWRNTPRAFAQDPMALVLAQEAVATGVPGALPVAQRVFAIMPYEHSESRIIQAQAQRLFGQFASAQGVRIQLEHKTVIDRFGRYPHRNRILGRVSTPEEETFLNAPARPAWQR
ncbi:MAG TPA: DUF924 family protein [Nevskiaceae bacterium]